MGCGGKCGGTCSDCKKIKGKEVNSRFCDPYFTGNQVYDGVVFECSNNIALNLTTGRRLNDILIGFATQLCQQSVPVYQSVANNTPNVVAAGVSEIINTITVVETGRYRIDFGVNLSVLDTAKWNSYITLSIPSDDYSISGNNSWGENISGATVQQNGSNSIIGINLQAGTIVNLYIAATTANITASSSMLAITKMR